MELVASAGEVFDLLVSEKTCVKGGSIAGILRREDCLRVFYLLLDNRLTLTELDAVCVAAARGGSLIDRASFCDVFRAVARRKFRAITHSPELAVLDELRRVGVISRPDFEMGQMFGKDVVGDLRTHEEVLKRLYCSYTSEDILAGVGVTWEEVKRLNIHMTIDGFVKCMAARGVCPDLLGKSTLEGIVRAVKSRPHPLQLAPDELLYPHFQELLCRVAVAATRASPGEAAEQAKQLASQSMQRMSARRNSHLNALSKKTGGTAAVGSDLASSVPDKAPDLPPEPLMAGQLRALLRRIGILREQKIATQQGRDPLATPGADYPWTTGGGAQSQSTPQLSQWWDSSLTPQSNLNDALAGLAGGIVPSDGDGDGEENKATAASAPAELPNAAAAAAAAAIPLVRGQFTAVTAEESEKRLSEMLKELAVTIGAAPVPEKVGEGGDMSEDLACPTRGVLPKVPARFTDLTGARAIVIKEVMRPPRCPEQVLFQIEAAMLYHNTSRYTLALKTYSESQALWEEMCMAAAAAKAAAEEETIEYGRVSPAPNSPAPAPAPAPVPVAGQDDEVTFEVPPEGVLFLLLSRGGVFDSMGDDEAALSQYMAALVASEALPDGHADAALAFSCLGSICYHWSRLPLALRLFDHCVLLREASLGMQHVDTAAAWNNVGACLDAMNRTEEAIFRFDMASQILAAQLGPQHPRATTALRNLSLVRRRPLELRQNGIPLGLQFRTDRKHVIPGGTFIINAIPPAKAKKAAGGKKRKKGGGKKRR